MVNRSLGHAVGRWFAFNDALVQLNSHGESREGISTGF